MFGAKHVSTIVRTTASALLTTSERDKTRIRFIRAQTLTGAEKGGDMAKMEALVDQCMSEYDENGWTGDTWT